MIDRMAHQNPSQTILAIGPLPPPVAGTNISFKIFCDTVSSYHLNLEIIDSSPRFLGSTRFFTVAHLRTASKILVQYCRRIGRTEQILIFSTRRFLLSMAPVLLLIAKSARRPLYVRIFGGSLDTYYDRLSPIGKWYFRWFIGHVDGVMVQTELLYEYFGSWLGDKVHLVPGYRTAPLTDPTSISTPLAPSKPLNLAYVGHIREEKGVFDLFESMRKLTAPEQQSIRCDIFGPIYPGTKRRFERELARVPCVSYRGALDPDDIVPTLRRYDALVFPSYWTGEGHPGVLIEAMMAGIPSITTSFRSIPELVRDRVNGLLVSPRSPEELVAAIRSLREERQLLADLARGSWHARTRYLARNVVSQILEVMGIDMSTEARRETNER